MKEEIGKPSTVDTGLGALQKVTRIDEQHTIYAFGIPTDGEIITDCAICSRPLNRDECIDLYDVAICAMCYERNPVMKAEADGQFKFELEDWP